MSDFVDYDSNRNSLSETFGETFGRPRLPSQQSNILPQISRHSDFFSSLSKSKPMTLNEDDPLSFLVMPEVKVDKNKMMLSDIFRKLAPKN
jgi:hypothetical protein